MYLSFCAIRFSIEMYIECCSDIKDNEENLHYPSILINYLLKLSATFAKVNRIVIKTTLTY